MSESDSKRNFAHRVDDEEVGTYSGSTPRQAALKIARNLETDYESEEEAKEEMDEEIRIREKGTDKVHIYDAWAWEQPKDDIDGDPPDWIPDPYKQGNVSKQGVEHLDDE